MSLGKRLGAHAIDCSVVGLYALMDLSPAEIRVLGCLLEKQVTTPDTYPLTLNSLRLACNQATNRDPVVDYDDAILRDALRRLERRGYIRLASGHSSRASKYRHLLAEALPLSAQEHAVLCVLMLRGPQTPGELKQRGERMHAFAGLDEVHETLEQLIARELVRRLERRPGQKEERYEQLLGSALLQDAPTPASPVPLVPSVPDNGLAIGDRPLVTSPVGSLEERVARLERAVEELRSTVR